VCGSADHPLPAAGAEVIEEGQERAAEAAWRTADESRRRAEETQGDVDRRLAAARAVAGGDAPVTQLAAELTGSEARCKQAQALAAGLPGAQVALATHEVEGEQQRARLGQARLEQADLEARIAAVLERAVTVTDRLAAALGDDPSVEARVTRLGNLARRCTAVADTADDLTRARRALEDARRGASEAAEAAGFAALDDARGAALPDAQVQRLDEQLRAAAAEEAAVAELLSDPGLAIDDGHPAGAAGDGEAEKALVGAEARLTATQDAVAVATAAAKGAGERSTRLESLCLQLAEHLDTIEPARARQSVLDGLAQLVDGRSAHNALRMRLSAYVLAARLEQVAAAASVRLLRMSGGRYTLEHTDAGSDGRSRAGLGLVVRDAWTGVARETTTLSGGESFFASLALALGLADVVTAEAGGALIETLFVDEGFGSLDEDTLDEVMGVLDDLRDGGRAVGIVSHVADLRGRVPAQLHVRKTRTGSTLAPASLAQGAA
jgi:exonuclease SbcC